MPFWKRKTPEQKAQELIDATDFREVNDGFFNSTTGVGTPARDAAVGFAQPLMLSEIELSDLVDYYWLARRVVRALPEAAHQDKILFRDDADQETWDRINALEGNDDGAFMTADVWARTHGCSLLILGQDWGGNPEAPHNPNAPIEWLEPIAAYDFYVAEGDLNQNRLDAKRFGKPEHYTIMGHHRFAGTKIHHSRVVHFAGPTLSDPLHSRDWRKMQQLSALDPVYSTLSQYALSWQAVADMMQQGSIPVWTLKGLITGLRQGASDLIARMKIQNEGVSINKAVMLDADHNESYERKAVSLADVPETMKQLAIQVSAAGDIPVGEIFGKLIAGLGDTENVADRRWERRVQKHRTRTLDPRLKRIMPDSEWNWQPITVPTPTEKADLTRKYWDMGQVTNDEVREITVEALDLPKLTPEGEAELEKRNAATSAPSGPGFSPFGEGAA